MPDDLTIDEVLQRAAEALDANLRRSEEDFELWKTGRAEDDAQIDLLIAEQRAEFAIFRAKTLRDAEEWMRGGYRRDMH